jgi:LmbE family N-acetylglucosaminyl deacetylase
MMEKMKILLITAHADDETSCGGTIAKLTKQGHEVVIAVATNGNKGTHDPSVQPLLLSQQRHQEMENACKILGASKLIWFNFDDGTLNETPELKERIYRTIRLEKPDVVITFDPWRKWDFHPDHRVIGYLATEAAYLADGFRYFPEHHAEGIEPAKPKEVYLFGSDEPNYFVDITDTWEIKYQAADAHESQGSGGSTFGQNFLKRMRAISKSESDLYREAFRKAYQTPLNL